MAQRLLVKDKTLYRAMRDHGISKKKAQRVLADVLDDGGSKSKTARGKDGKDRGRKRHRLRSVKGVAGRVRRLRKH